MHIFALKSIEGIVSKQQVDMLVENEVCYFEEFETELKTRKNQKFINELGHVFTIVERLANCESLPQKKFKDITPRKETVREYEIKTKNLRVYLIKKTNGKIIVLAGFKNRQKGDIRKFRNIKSRYLEYKNQSK
jgi:putative component of toxin-antitoxin plasmid stabilization module